LRRRNKAALTAKTIVIIVKQHEQGEALSVCVFVYNTNTNIFNSV